MIVPRRRIAPRSTDGRIQDEVEQELDELIASIAAEFGPADGAEHVSPEQEVALWNQKDPRVDFDTLKSQLMAGQVPPEMFDPENKAGYEYPKAVKDDPLLPGLREKLQGPVDEEMATQIATVVEYPFRLPLLAAHQDDPHEHVKRADQIDARWQKRQGVAEADPASEPYVAPAPQAAPGALDQWGPAVARPAGATATPQMGGA